MPRSYQQLTYDERCQITALKGRGDCPAEIAKQLNRSRSTIHREIRRNGSEDKYQGSQAHTKARHRRFRKPSKMTPVVVATVEKKIKLQWSPEQIAGRLKKESQGISISHETIYKHIWRDKRQGGSLYKHLRQSGKKYKRGAGAAGRGYIPNRRDIDQRPAIANDKTRVGDWELDTIIGANHEGVIVSMVDRHSKLTKLAKIMNKTAESVRDVLLEKLGPTKHLVHTLTADNGKEFAYHEEIARMLEADFFFAKPYHSWERGLNEHTNGLIRQYLPKTTIFSGITHKLLDSIEALLNQRPRKVLNFQTPSEVFQQWAEIMTCAE